MCIQFFNHYNKRIVIFFENYANAYTYMLKICYTLCELNWNQ